MKVVVTPREAALRAKCSIEQIVNWVEEGKIEVFKVNGKKTSLILEKSLKKWIALLWVQKQREMLTVKGIEKMNIYNWFN